MPQRDPIRDRSRIIDSRQHGGIERVQYPTRGWDNRPLNNRIYEDRYHRALPPGRDHYAMLNHSLVIGNIRGIHAGWDVRDHGYYWHEWNGYRLCHHYDDLGFHWWGFYVGDVYFWTRYWNDQYWWYDPYWHRWTYLRGDNWWWQDPARAPN